MTRLKSQVELDCCRNSKQIVLGVKAGAIEPLQTSGAPLGRLRVGRKGTPMAPALCPTERHQAKARIVQTGQLLPQRFFVFASLPATSQGVVRS